MRQEKGKIKKVVLAYSGGLDTSVILKWLQDTYDCEVVTFTADIGQGGEVAPARAKAKKMGVTEIFVDEFDRLERVVLLVQGGAGKNDEGQTVKVVCVIPEREARTTGIRIAVVFLQKIILF